MCRCFSCVAILVFLAFLSFAFFSCKRNSDLSNVKREDKCFLNYGNFEDQLNLFDLNSTGTINTDIAMRDGFFYISNGESQKILLLNSYGDLLTLYYNPETNPTPLFDSNSSKSNSTYSTRKTVTYPFNQPSSLALDSRQYFYVVEVLPKERYENSNNKILRQVVLRFNSDSFVDYIGQQGRGGTPFPFIRKIYTTTDNNLVVVCVVSEGLEVFCYNPSGTLLYDKLIKYSDAPKYGENKFEASRFAEVENVVPDPSSKILFVKTDYYETSVDSSGKSQSGSADPLTVVFPYNPMTNEYGTGIEIPPYEESITAGFAKQIYKLPYEFMGATTSGWLFFTLALDSGCVVQMVRNDGSRIVRRHLGFETKDTVYSAFSLNDSGIISALLAEHDKAKIVWWRTDDLARSIGQTN